MAGATTALHGGIAQLRSLAHGLVVPVVLDGSHGRLRIFVEPKPPWRAVWGELICEGPTEDDLAAEEANRFARVQARRDAMLTTLSDLQATLGLPGSAAGAIPVLAAFVDTALQALALAIEGCTQKPAQAIDRANLALQQQNLSLAEAYPERGPVGGPEDEPRP